MGRLRRASRRGAVEHSTVAEREQDREGFWWRPSWQALPGEWQHGWQFWASAVSDTHFRERSILSVRAAAGQAHLRSHSVANAGVACAPTAPEYTIPPRLFRVLLLERLQLPLLVSEATCSGCQAPLDALGRHRASCTLRQSSQTVERTVARICREAGARVRQCRHRGRHPSVEPSWLWSHCAVSCLLQVSPHPHTAEEDGVVLLREDVP